MLGHQPSWLTQVVETALEPELPLIDAHFHAWPDVFAPYVDALGRASPEAWVELIASSGHNIVAGAHTTTWAQYDATTLPEDLRPVAETAYLDREGERLLRVGGPCARWISAISGSANMQLGDRIEAVLDAHQAASPDRFRGIRDDTAWHTHPQIAHSVAEPGRLCTPAAIEASRRLAARGLVLEAWVYHTQLDDVIAVARAVPDLTIVLNHVGTPITDPNIYPDSLAVFSAWRTSLRALAQHHNVKVKLGGLAMEMAVGNLWAARERPPTSEELARGQRPFINTAIELFTPARAMFESNYPTEKVSASYGVIWNALKRIAADFSADEKKALFLDTARQTYRIDLAD